MRHLFAPVLAPTVALLVCLLFGCGSSLHGDWAATDVATDTDTHLSLRPDGSYALELAPRSGGGSRVVLEGHFTAVDGELLTTVRLQHSRMTVDGEDGIVVSEQISDGALCAPQSQGPTFCVPAEQQFSASITTERMSLERPPFSFMARKLRRA